MRLGLVSTAGSIPRAPGAAQSGETLAFGGVRAILPDSGSCKFKNLDSRPSSMHALRTGFEKALQLGEVERLHDVRVHPGVPRRARRLAIAARGNDLGLSAGRKRADAPCNLVAL